MLKRKNTGKDFESYMQYVYSTLLNLRGENIQVSRGTTFRLPSGESYEIDVYYEFYKAGVRHRVAIECKDWSRPIDQGKILEFHQKIKNIGNDIVGVIASKSGYQAGVEKIAARHNILLLTGNDIPTLPQLVGHKIISAALHEPDLPGEPFWVIAERDNESGKYSTGSYYAHMANSTKLIPLFISKKYAELFLNRLHDREIWEVYGMPQYKLKTFIALVKPDKVKLGIVSPPPEPNGYICAIGITAGDLERDFVI
ncbi:Uncharacterised protein [Burkholderia pseudomallei]|nr:Uncharacterised protein [Burkholderia pseudomallei]